MDPDAPRQGHAAISQDRLPWPQTPWSRSWARNRHCVAGDRAAPPGSHPPGSASPATPLVERQFRGLGEQHVWDLCDRAFGSDPLGSITLAAAPCSKGSYDPLMILGGVASQPARAARRVRALPVGAFRSSEVAKQANLRFDRTPAGTAIRPGASRRGSRRACTRASSRRTWALKLGADGQTSSCRRSSPRSRRSGAHAQEPGRGKRRPGAGWSPRTPWRRRWRGFQFFGQPRLAPRGRALVKDTLGRGLAPARVQRPSGARAALPRGRRL